MNALIDGLKALRLHGMAGCAHDLLASRTPPNLTTALKQLIEAETVERRVRSIEYQMRVARFPHHKDFATFDYADIPHIPSKFMEFVPLSHRQGNCIPYAAIRWHDFGNRPALGRPLGHFSRHPDTPLLSLSPRRRFPRPTPERVFVADHQSSSGFSGTGPSAPPPQPIGT